MSVVPQVQRYKNVEVPRQQGEVARLRVLKGPDRGLIYLLRGSSIILGRGEEAGVVISDLKASRSHARLDYTKAGWVLTDLGSVNGIFFNGEYTRSIKLRSGEHFSLGETTLEFLGSSESTQVLTAPLPLASDVQFQDQALANQKQKVRSLSKPKKAVSSKKTDQKRTLLLVAALGAAYYLTESDSFNSKPVRAPQKKVEVEKPNELSSYLPAGVSDEVAKSAELHYRQGFREFREENYLRARAQFELALQVNPSHELARHYLNSADHEIEVELKSMIEAAQKAIFAGRLREAKGYYETAMRLMYHDQSNPYYLECEEGLKKIEKELDRGI